MKTLDKKKPKELEWEKEFDDEFFHFSGDDWNEACLLSLDDTRPMEECSCQIKDIKQFIKQTLTQQRTELEQQKVKVVWNDVCEQIKQEARTELLEEIKTRVDTWGGFEDDGGNLCHYDSEILEWVNDLLNKKNEINRGKEKPNL